MSSYSVYDYMHEEKLRLEEKQRMVRKMEKIFSFDFFIGMCYEQFMN